MEYLTLIFSVAMIHLLAVMSPGPDFIVTCRNALTYSRRTGIYTAIGMGLGISIHIIYCLAGLALIISQSILVFNAIKLLGAGYLIWIGIQSFMAKKSKIDLGKTHRKEDIPMLSGIKSGFLTNVLNPKVTLFFLSLFTMMIPAETPFVILLVMSAIMILNTSIWFSLVAVFLTKPKIRAVFERFQGIFNKISGGLLITLGIKIAVTEK